MLGTFNKHLLNDNENLIIQLGFEGVLINT